MMRVINQGVNIFVNRMFWSSQNVVEQSLLKAYINNAKMKNSTKYEFPTP